MLHHGFIENAQRKRNEKLAGVQTEPGRDMNNIGSSLDSYLRVQGISEEVAVTAIRHTLARQVEAAMHAKQFTRTELALRIHTSRAALDRLLDPECNAVTQGTLRKAAVAVGREPRIDRV